MLAYCVKYPYLVPNQSLNTARASLGLAEARQLTKR